LPKGNALVEGATFVAILLGTIAGGLVIGVQPNGAVLSGVLGVVVAVLGYLASRGVPPTPAVDPTLTINWNPVTETLRNLRIARENRVVWLSMLGISWFWFYGATFLAQFPGLARDFLGGDERVVTFLLALFSIGIGTGALLCERLSGRKIEIGLVPFGAIGLTLFAVDLWLAARGLRSPEVAGLREFLSQPVHWRVMLDLLMIGVFGGFYIVPLYAIIQSRSDAAHRSRIVAGNNILNAAFMVAAALAAIGLFAAGLTIPQLILVIGLMNAAVAIYIYALVPEFLMRFMVWMLIHSVYRLRKSGLERIPEEGPAILVCNHVSYVDALVISAGCRRPIRWVMDHRIFKVPLLSFFFRTAKAIPIAPAKEDPEVLERAYSRIADELAASELIGLFPEGRLTSDGEMGEFRGGIMRVLARSPVPVVPMALSGLWQSLFARNRDKLRHVATLFPRVRLAVGEPLAPETVTPQGLHAAVAELRGAWR
jgi:1-acyl-sn-glycerol-3-phosphate acyltransferase